MPAGRECDCALHYTTEMTLHHVIMINAATTGRRGEKQERKHGIWRGKSVLSIRPTSKEKEQLVSITLKNSAL